MSKDTLVIRILCLLLATLTLSSCQSSDRASQAEKLPAYNLPCHAQPSQLSTASYKNTYSPIPIESMARAKADQLIEFFKKTNPLLSHDYLASITQLYIDEAHAEGINSDIAFCQMVLETNYLRFNGDVKAWQNNFAGLGAIGGGEPGLAFPSVQIGIRAHIQHLKAYANRRPLCSTNVDPRFIKVPRASSPYIYGLTGTWAKDPQYGAKIKRNLQKLEDLL